VHRRGLHAVDRLDGLAELALDGALVVDLLLELGGGDAFLVEQRIPGLAGAEDAGDLDAVTGAQANADNLAVQAATGQLTDPAQLTIATTQATLMTQLASTLQSKAVTAFNTIMGMQA